MKDVFIVTSMEPWRGPRVEPDAIPIAVFHERTDAETYIRALRVGVKHHSGFGMLSIVDSALHDECPSPAFGFRAELNYRGEVVYVGRILDALRAATASEPGAIGDGATVEAALDAARAAQAEFLANRARLAVEKASSIGHPGRTR